VLGWVSRGFGAASLMTNVGHMGHPSRWDRGGSSSLDINSPPTGSRASSSEPALLSVRPLREGSVFRVSAERTNNAYNVLPVTTGGVFRRAELDVESIFVTRL